jgi:tetratricopeptide (TPR) repeat protein
MASYQSGLGAVLNDWGNLNLSDGDAKTAGPLIWEAIQHQKAALAIEPRSPQYRKFLCNHLVSWSDIAELNGDHLEAVKVAREAVALQESLVEDYPDLPYYRHSVAEFSSHLGDLVQNDNPADAEAAYRRSIALLDSLKDTFNDIPTRRRLLVWCDRQLGRLLERGDRHVEAIPLYQDALKWEPENAAVLGALGRLLLIREEKADEAEPLLRKALAIREQETPDALAVYYLKSLLGDCLIHLTKYEEAEAILLASYEGMKQREAQMKDLDRVYLIQSISNLVQVYEHRGLPEKAADWQRKLDASTPPRD